jgi:hypothetical protein
MNAGDGQVNVVEELMMEFDGEAGAEENHHLPLPIPFQKCKEEEEPLLSWTNDVACKYWKLRNYGITH